MLNVAVCDDDLIFATNIETMLMGISKKQLIEMTIEVYSDGNELWNDLIAGVNFDILYLDIEMVYLSGIDVARKIRAQNMDSIIIYISNYENYFIELFEVEPFRFIKKPVDKNIFINYFQKAYEKILREDTYFEYKFNKVQHKILIKNIMYFESKGRVVSIYSKDDDDKFYGKLNNVEKQLEGGKIQFLRIHQSYLVNYRFIKEIYFSKVVLIDGRELQISEDRQRQIRKKYADIFGGEFLDE